MIRAILVTLTATGLLLLITLIVLVIDIPVSTDMAIWQTVPSNSLGLALWRTALYGFTLWRWRGFRLRLLARDPASRQRLFCAEVAATAAFILLEISIWR
ncbi:TPA: hypothetical protein L9M67_003863 [Klebsiella quasipneumoniae subsp. quasipneumoniae]|nr:hypothetical protein [Klebsiella quasipneumoniae subsp. quasipneumoniae]